MSVKLSIAECRTCDSCVRPAPCVYCCRRHRTNACQLAVSMSTQIRSNVSFILIPWQWLHVQSSVNRWQ